MLVVSNHDYLHRPLVDLARHLHGADHEVLAVRAWPGIDRRLLLALFAWYLPFRVARVLTPSDLGGRLVRIILDVAALLGVETCVVPAHNHALDLDPDAPPPWPRRYADLSRPRVVGRFAGRARLLLHDEVMRQFFLAMGHDPRRLLVVPGWMPALYRRDAPRRYQLVFFTEVMHEIDRRQFRVNLDRVVRLVQGGWVPRLHVKLHPRETAESVAAYRAALGGHPGVEFIADGAWSIDVVNESAVVMASASTVLLEALWLGTRIVILDNPVFPRTLLARYVGGREHLVYGEPTDPAEVARYCAGDAGAEPARSLGARAERRGPGAQGAARRR